MASEPQASASPACILNGKSVHLKAGLAHIARTSAEFGIERRVLVTRRGDDVSAMAAGALAEGHKPIVAGGGDGTVNAVAGNLVGTGIALGVLPMGTLNHFAKDVGIPLHVEAAVRNLFTGQLIEADVARSMAACSSTIRAQASIRILCANAKSRSDWDTSSESRLSSR